MTIRLSSALRSFVSKYGSLGDALHNGKLKIYTGTQPSSADAAPTGTLLCTITVGSAAHTAEVLSFGTVELTGGASGSVNTLTVNSVEVMGAAVAFNSTLTQTAADVAAQINRFQSVPNYTATSSGAIVTIKALPGTGTGPNTYVVATGVTTITKTDTNFSGGIAAANGLKFGDVVAGVLSKLSTQTWSGVNANTGTAGWARFEAATVDSAALDSTESQLRMDMAIATSGSDMNLSSTAFTSAATTTLSAAAVTLPAS